MMKERTGKHGLLRSRLVGVAVGSLAGLASTAAGSVVADFEDLSLTPESFYNGADGAGGFVSGGASFNNTFGGFTGWIGWSYSNVTDNTTPGFTNQYSAIPGHGAEGSSNYGVAFGFDPGDVVIDLAPSSVPQSMFITNTTYAFLDMRDGSAFSKQFGGATGDDPDFFLLTVTGLDALGAAIGTVDFYLADFRFDDNSQDYLVYTWTEVDLSSLAGASSLSFGLTGSDVGAFGLNTPAYFALDNLRTVPEPATLALLMFGGVAALRRRRRL